MARFASAGLSANHEWRARLTIHGAYSPRLDVAVGPFAFDNLQCGPEYDAHGIRCAGFIEAITTSHATNIARYRLDGAPDSTLPTPSNYNARCFIAIEIENQVTRKHLMGGAINAAALGRIGIVVGWDPKKVQALVRTKTYLEYLDEVRKPTFPIRNLFILSEEQLLVAMAALPPSAL